MNAFAETSYTYRCIAQALEYLHHHPRSSLSQLAAVLGYSEGHIQRQFAQWVGISPKRFQQYLTKEYARRLLRLAPDVLSAAYDSGLSSAGRLHDLFITSEAMTPGQYRDGGQGLVLRWGTHATPFGQAWIVSSPHGVCRLAFIDSAAALAREQAYLAAEWPLAQRIEDQAHSAQLLQRIFAPPPQPQPLHIWLRGSNFQLQVWQALLRIPAGQVVSYQQIAHCVQLPKAARAVGQAVGSNPLAYIIPCHRVLTSSGAVGGYHWGIARKLSLLGWEAAQRATEIAEC